MKVYNFGNDYKFARSLKNGEHETEVIEEHAEDQVPTNEGVQSVAEEVAEATKEEPQPEAPKKGKYGKEKPKA